MSHSSLVGEEIISQYRDSPKMIAYVQALLLHADELESEAGNVLSKRSVNTAQGVQLDIIGIIVGVSREVVDFIDSIYFGFDPDVTAKEFEDLYSPSVNAGRYRSADESPVNIRRLDDTEYRTYIQAKILKNSTNITPNDVLIITKKILGVMFPSVLDIPININETLDASFEIQISANISTSQQSFIANLDLIPRPVGVRISYLYSAPPTNLLDESGLILFYEDGTPLEIE